MPCTIQGHGCCLLTVQCTGFGKCIDFVEQTVSAGPTSGHALLPVQDYWMMQKKMVIVPYVAGSADMAKPLQHFKQSVLPLASRTTLLHFRAGCLPYGYLFHNQTGVATGKVSQGCRVYWLHVTTIARARHLRSDTMSAGKVKVGELFLELHVRESRPATGQAQVWRSDKICQGRSRACLPNAHREHATL